MNDKSNKDRVAKSDRSIREERPDLAARFADLAAQEACDNLFPKRIKSLRQDLDIRQNEMADILGVPSTTYANWEQGRAFPSVDRLPRIAAFFDVTVDYLLGANRDTVNRRIVEQLAVLSPEQRQAVELVLSSMNSNKKSSNKSSKS
ncbi:Transcriptional regulator, contains XRE-family HTH domain [Selenomonas sp. GACV-9]|uniref:helix-turn-helix domain-containing protein n=1 Tax=unclassified Selenomonas TaxID=2637378 RepID=UPI000883443F|nr:Transcriptional regulator, contains XRE-family HTH domain [Selenomonas ruminantium]SFT67202.1 Transcriptional regulator, contains XRE-family HTH domain [Selenomonas ruminantium]